MAKTVAPLLSFGAGGQIAKTQVYATWRGVPYVRRYVVPGNPRTAEQTETRSTFKWLTQVWKLLDAGAQAPWTAATKGLPLTNRNLWIKQNLPPMRGLTTITTLIVSPGSGGGSAPTSIAATGGSGTIGVTLGEPDLPAGWSITAASAVAIKQADSQTSTSYTSLYATDVSSPYEPSFGSVAPGTYVVSGFFTYMKPDGTVAYSPSLTTTATVT